MPKKTLGNKRKEDKAQKKIKQQTSKQRQYDRKEREFYRAQVERGMCVRPIGFKEKNMEGMVEFAIVYKLKEGCKDPFDADSVLYSINTNSNKVTKRQKIPEEITK